MKSFLSLLLVSAVRSGQRGSFVPARPSLGLLIGQRQFNLPAGSPRPKAELSKLANALRRQPFSWSAPRCLFGSTTRSPINSGGSATSGPDKGAPSGEKRRSRLSGDERKPSTAARQAGKSCKQRAKMNSNERRPNTRASSKAAKGASSVRHDKGRRQFVMELGDKLEARIDYRPLAGNKIDMYHTEVPEHLRNQGIGRALAKASLEQAQAEKMRVKLTCSYLINYLDKFGDAKLRSFVEK